MSNTLKVKEQYKNLQIGFNHSAAPLGLRNDIDILYRLGKENNLAYILEYFEEVSEVDEKNIEEEKGLSFLKSHKEFINKPQEEKPEVRKVSLNKNKKP